VHLPIYLPTYSPKLNPIELWWGHLKATLRSLRIALRADLGPRRPPAPRFAAARECRRVVPVLEIAGSLQLIPTVRYATLRHSSVGLI
jgi:hypothetical protein